MADPALPKSQPSLESGAWVDTQTREAPGMRLVLALDTCGAESTLALVELADDDSGGPNLPGDAVHLIRERTLPARTAGSMLTSAMRDVLGSVPPNALYAIVVVRGPGSFTGMRIGLSAAKALSQACAIPLVAVSRLAVLSAANCASRVALDAGRGRVYLGSFPGSPAQEHLLDVQECREVLGEDPGQSTGEPRSSEARLTVCEARLASLFPEAVRVAPPTALDAIHHAKAQLAARDWDDAASLDALYLWRPEQMLTSPAHPA